MCPSSSRIKLNRGAFKDVVGPRRRRLAKLQNNVTADFKKQEENQLVSVKDTTPVPSANERVQTPMADTVGPGNVTDAVAEGEPEEKRVGTQKAKRRRGYESGKGDHGVSDRQAGPCTRGRYQQSQPNIRSRGGPLRVTCWFCDSALFKPMEARRRRVKPRGTTSGLSRPVELSSEAAESETTLELKCAVGKSSGRCKSSRGDIIIGKTRVNRGAAGGGDRGGEGQRKGKARSTAAAAAKTRQVHTDTRPVPTRLSNIDRNTHPSPTGLGGSEGSLRRAVRASGCGLIGDCTCISLQKKTVCEQRQMGSGPGPELPKVDVKNAKQNAETSKKIVIWINQYPKVTLCDIAQKCEAFSHNCGYVLPEFLKTKVVHCFKQDMRTGFQFGPGRLGRNPHESEENALAKNRVCPRVQSKKNGCRPQSLTEHQRPLKERTDVQMLSSHSECSFLNSWTSEGSATCSASFLLGERTKKGVYRTGMLDKDAEDNPGPGSRPIGADIHRDKRIKLADNVKDRMLPSTSNLESISCKDQAKPDSRDNKKTCLWMSGQSCLEHADRGCSPFSSTMTENIVHQKPCGEMDNPTESDVAQMSSKLCSQRNEVDTDESFTCQRVRVYFRKIKFSCARTYMSWPFSNSGCTLTAHSGATGCQSEPIYPSARDNRDSQSDQNQPGSSSNGTNDRLPDAPIDASSSTAQQFSHQNEEKRDEDEESIIAGRNGQTHGNKSSYSMEFVPRFMEAEESLAGLSSDTATLSNASQRGRKSGTDTISASSLPVNGHATDSSMSTASLSALGPSDCETATTSSPMSSPFTPGGLSCLSATPSPLPPSLILLKKVVGVELAGGHSESAVTSVEKHIFYCEDTQMTPWASSSAPPHSSDSFGSCESSLLLPQDEQASDEGRLTDRSLPKLEPYYNTSPVKHDRAVVKASSLHSVLADVETDSNGFMLPPVLSPVTSPWACSQTSFLTQSCSDEDTREHTISPGCHKPQIVISNNENSKDYLKQSSDAAEGVSSNLKTILRDYKSPPSNDGYDMERSNKSVSPHPKLKADLPLGALTEPCSSRSSHEDDGGAFRDEGQPHSTREEGLSPPDISRSKRDKTIAEAAGDAQYSRLDEFTAYEQDILLVDVIQDDPELFENMPQESLLKLGPVRVTEAPKTRPIRVVKTLLPRIDGASLELEQNLSPVKVDFHCDSPDITEECDNRSWRPQRSSNPQCNTWPATEKHTKNMGQPDANNNRVNGLLDRSRSIHTANSMLNHTPPLMTARNVPQITNPGNTTATKCWKFKAYCRQYFSESLSCGFKTCRFHHVPVEGDEKLCIETVTRFTKNPMCLQKAGAVFTGYYRNNPPGVFFSMHVLLSLLWALLKAGMVSDIFSVLRVSLIHKIVPGHEFLLALFNIVREKGLMGVVPELMQLTFKMANAGLVLSLDCLDSVKNTPEFRQAVHSPNPIASVAGNYKFSAGAPSPEYLNLAHSIVEIELCTKQEDWRRMGEVFRSICQSRKHPNQVGRISGRIAIALLSESKDKLSLPFAAFAETVCQNEVEESLSRSFLGRIGVSLMLRYHKTHQWAKGRRVVEVLSMSKVNYSTLKGLFGNEDGASRCYLVTVATELFLLSGSLEGALNTLRENKWFLSSCSWPCEPADLESRTRVLIRLAEKTSHRDTLEVLCNLPGLKEPNDLIDISKYGPLFNTHLQVCVDRQILPVASDTMDFMLFKNLAVNDALLQTLLQKLGKQNLWLRAREVFKHSLSMGYYPGVSAPPGFMALIVPCRLGEVELALSLEMFITVNATGICHLSETNTSCLTITLKRTQSCESEYLSAGSRILSAACIPQPKLIVHYTAVNSSQDQVFTLDISSARCWLRHNHLWANEVWTH